MIPATVLDALFAHRANLNLLDELIEEAGRTARSLTEARTKLAQVAWRLQQLEASVKFQIDTVLDEAKAAKAAAAKKSKTSTDTPAKRGKR